MPFFSMISGCLLFMVVGLLLALLFSSFVTFIQANWLILSLVILGVWGWRLWQQRAAKWRSRQQFLRDTFYYLLQLHQGRLTVFEFAMHTNLSGTEAREYLNDRAKEFEANFETSDRGDILYVFPVLPVPSTPIAHLPLDNSRLDHI